MLRLQVNPDMLLQVIPVEPPWQLKGTVVKGFGRGSKELGIPTANLDSASLQSALAEAVTGIYCGWASIGSSPEIYPMVSAAAWSTLPASWHCAAWAGSQAMVRLPASKLPASCVPWCLYPATATQPFRRRLPCRSCLWAGTLSSKMNQRHANHGCSINLIQTSMTRSSGVYSAGIAVTAMLQFAAWHVDGNLLLI